MTEAVTRPSPGTPCWASLMVHDLAASQRFYGELLGWEYRRPAPQQQLGGHVQAVRNGVPVAGLGEMAPELRRPVAWLPYIATDEADATATLIRDCGGTVAVGPLDVDSVGRLAIAADPQGAAFGIWQTGDHPGAPYHDAHGVPVWAKLITVDAGTVGKFYSMVFGYEWHPEPSMPPEVDYLTILLRGYPIVGVQGIGDAVPHDRGPYWLTYFSVDDPDAEMPADSLAGKVLQVGRRRFVRLTG
jgi:uncharacterized protein